MLAWPCLDRGADSFSINAKAIAAIAEHGWSYVSSPLEKSSLASQLVHLNLDG